jgi:RNA polymerase sigma-70 factor (ECF subfamily)
MSEGESFADLIRQVRQGDARAAERLVRRYEPAVRRVVQLRLQHSSLRRHIDSVDVCQSVLASFFCRAALGQYDLSGPEQLVKLLTAMARNKFANQARKRQGLPADPVPGRAATGGLEEAAADEPSPSRLAAGRDLLAAVRARLREDERVLADFRARGLEWPEIAAELGGTPDALRKKLTRALDRVARVVGLED